MPGELKDVKITFLALTKRGSNKVRSSIFKSEGSMKKIFKEEAEKEAEAGVFTVLKEVGEIASQFKKGELEKEDVTDMLDEILIKHGGDELVIKAKKHEKEKQKNKEEAKKPISKADLFEKYGVKKNDIKSDKK